MHQSDQPEVEPGREPPGRVAGDGRGPGARLERSWRRLNRLPGGRWLFSRLIGRMVPYSGSISPKILELRPGFARIELRDRRRVRNHLDSIHAIALLNLAELTSGLAMLVGSPPSVRSIVTGISMEYLKKARGRLVAESHVSFPIVEETVEHVVHAVVHDAKGDAVARATVHWRLSPAEPVDAATRGLS